MFKSNLSMFSYVINMTDQELLSFTEEILNYVEDEYQKNLLLKFITHCEKEQPEIVYTEDMRLRRLLIKNHNAIAINIYSQSLLNFIKNGVF